MVNMLDFGTTSQASCALNWVYNNRFIFQRGALVHKVDAHLLSFIANECQHNLEYCFVMSARSRS